MDMSKYKGMFISETKEHLQTMNQLIVSLEKDPSHQENIEALFRVAHSVKGMAASMGYHDVADLSHKMEDMMDHFRKGELIINPDAVDIFFEVLDILEVMLKGIEEDQPANVDITSIIEKMNSFGKESPAEEEKEAGTGPEPPPPADTKASAPEITQEKEPEEAKPSEQEVLVVSIEIESSARVPGMRAFLTHKALSELGEITSTDPDIEDVKQGNFDNKVTFFMTGVTDTGKAEKILTSMPDVAGFSIRAELAGKPAGSGADEEGGTGPSDEKKKPARRSRKAPPVRTVRVTTNLLDNLINIIGEMIISRSKLLEVSKDIESVSLKEGMLEMSNLIRDLHDQVMSVRMTPLENMLERLPRVVRDLARKNDKKVDLRIEGKEIELDRAIIEEMGDPLVHILRNCVDHGIETTAEREKVGKNPAGNLMIRAMREKDVVILNISDDGKGMDAEKIKDKAIEKGLITREKAGIMNNREAFMLVCHSGLSTADQVTDVSGRGVGMDAVKNVVDFIGGSLDIDSIPGKGTNIMIKLPLTVAIVQVLITRLGNDRLAIPINKVIRTLEVEKKELKRSQKQTAVMVDDELIPLLSLRKILQIEQTPAAAPFVSIVVVEIKNRKIGLVVDALIGQQEAFIKPLDPPLEWIKGFSGATILGDGSVIFVLDIPNLL